MKWYKFAAAEYQIKTVHLSDAEDLAYRRLLDMAYLSEKPIPLDVSLVSRRVRIDQDIVEQVLSEFFELAEDGYHNKRVEQEVQAYQVIIERNKKGTEAYVRNAAERAALGAKKTQEKGNKSATSRQDATHEAGLEAGQNKNKNINPLTPLAGGFERFWSVWPSSPRKVGKAWCVGYWIKHDLEAKVDQIVAHVSSMKGTTQWLSGYEPAPKTYLNQRRWLDEDAPKPFARRLV
jgi:uncharacterized protein YdaU (DUF1376 family)